MVVVVVVVVTMTEIVIMEIGLSGKKIAMISICYHFMPHLVVNHLKAERRMPFSTHIVLCCF
jgi:hypothetical protein